MAELSFDTCKVQSRKMQVEQKHYHCTPCIPYVKHFIISDTNLTKISSKDTCLVQPWTLAHASWSPTPVAYPKGIGTGMFGKGWVQYFEQEVWLDAIKPDTYWPVGTAEYNPAKGSTCQLGWGMWLTASPPANNKTIYINRNLTKKWFPVRMEDVPMTQTSVKPKEPLR